MHNDVIKCPVCGHLSLFRRADMKPDWKCDYCDEYFDDEDLDDIDKLDEIIDREECDTIEE